jgi:iron complex transport system substrate-binding protein
LENRILIKKLLQLLEMLIVLLLVISQNGYCSEREVIDRLGRIVRVPIDPVRVISLAPSVTEVVFALGQNQRLKGATQFSNYPSEANSLPRVGSYVHLDVEKIVSLKPDLCLAIKDGNPIDTIRRLEKLNIPVYAVDPKNLYAVMEMISDIGDLLDAAPQAERIVTNMKERIEKIKIMVSQTSEPELPKVFFQIGVSPIVSVGTETFLHELISLSGGYNLTQGDIAYPRLTIEQVLAMAPDIIIITSMTRGQSFETVKNQWKKWKSIPAIKNNRIYLVDSDIVDRPTPRLVDGLELLVHYINPDLNQPH